MPSPFDGSHAPPLLGWNESGQQEYAVRVDSGGNIVVTPLQGAVQRSTAGYVAPGQTAKSFVGNQASSTTATTSVPLETVTAGKQLIITDIFISVDATTAQDVQITAGGVAIFRGHCSTTASVQMAGIETQPAASAGQAVALLLPQTGSIQHFGFSIYGMEQ